MSNPFDDLGGQFDLKEQQAQEAENEARHLKLNYLIHKTFEQTESGKELLALWTEPLILTPTARPGDDHIAIGIAEGKKEFIRNIILTVRKVSNE